MRQVAKRLAATALMAALTACQPIHGGEGQIGMRVQFPGEGFQVKMIPEATTSIRVTVSGEGLSSPKTATLTRTQPSIVLTVPAGTKTIDAVAADSQGKILALGKGQATVIALGKVTATVVLSPAPDASPTPSPSPSSSTPADVPPGSSPPPVGATTSPPPPSATPTPDPIATPDPTSTANSGGGTLAGPTPQPSPEPSVQINVTPGGIPTFGYSDL
jgi:hypothetical protein